MMVFLGHGFVDDRAGNAIMRLLFVACTGGRYELCWAHATGTKSIVMDWDEVLMKVKLSTLARFTSFLLG